MGIFDLFRHNIIDGPEFINSNKLDMRIKILDELLDQVGDDQKEIIENEKRLITAGNLGEENVIYELKHSKESMLIIHDVTIENRVKDSQIDFVLITRHGLIVLETKRLQGDIEINNEGEFTRLFKNAQGKVYKKEGIYSPVTQNRYHIDALTDLLTKNGFSSRIPMYSLVVIANPKTIVNKTYAKREIKDQIVKFDMLNHAIEKLLDNSDYDMSDNKMIEIGDLILDNDRPRVYDYVQKLHLVLKDKNSSESVEETAVIDDETVAKEHTDDTLYEALKSYRFEKAKAMNYKPYFIFTNEQLSQLVLKKPVNRDEFLAVQGMTPKKYEMYGFDIIGIIKSDVQNKTGRQIEKSSSQDAPTEIEKTTEQSSDTSSYNQLFEKLRTYRWKKAKELNVKPYFIFTNEQLENLIKAKPKTKEQFINIPGFGENKWVRFGEDIIGIINS